MEKRPTISRNAFVIASKLRAARFRSKVLSLENDRVQIRGIGWQEQ